MSDEYIGRKEVLRVMEQGQGVWWLEREPDGKPYCYHCSKCDLDGHFIHIRSATKYCPNCGAKMDTTFIYEYEDLT